MDGAPEPLTPRGRRPWREPSSDEATVALTPVTASDAAPALEDHTAGRRRILWRDSAMILIGVILAILGVQTFAPGGTGTPTGSGTPIPSGIVIGSLPPPVSLPPGVTLGPIVDPSLGVDATPTPIPVITLGPSPSPSPSPSPTRKPTPKPPTAPPPTATPPTATPPTATPPTATPPSAPPSESATPTVPSIGPSAG